MMKLSLILFLIYLVIALIALLINFLYKKRLKTLYPELAATLYPDMVHGNPFKRFKSGKSFGFLMRCEYRSLNNVNFVRLCDCYRVILILGYLTFAAAAITGVVFNR